MTMNTTKMCDHCKRKLGRWNCANQPDCRHLLCNGCIVWGAGDSGWCEKCKKGEHCRVPEDGMPAEARDGG